MSDEPSLPRAMPPADITRRRFIQSAATAAGAAAAPMSIASPGRPAADDPAHPTPRSAVTLHVNGELHELLIEPRLTLLDALREHLNLPGTKKGCDRGQCGACTVLVNGRRINSCLSLAIMHEHDRIVTIEGLSGPDGALHPMQAAFIRHDAFQCGFCTPGQICSAVALLDEHRARSPAVPPSAADIREHMSGNLCRCGAYPNIVAAIQEMAAHE